MGRPVEVRVLLAAPKALQQRLTGAVRVKSRHGRHAAVHGDEQVQRLGLTDLAHNEACRSHAQGLLDQPPQRHLALSLAACAGNPPPPVVYPDPPPKKQADAKTQLESGRKY